MLVREVSEFFIKKLGLELGEDEILASHHLFDSAISSFSNSRIGGESLPSLERKQHDKSIDFLETDLTIIMSRKHNRLITNEDQLAIHLKEKFGNDVVVLSNEQHSFEEQVKLLRRARIVVGMHGSILVMSMFCRRGTVLLEMYPYAVPSDDYTPYKTMAQLSGMDIIYRSWENKDLSANTAYPDRHELHGGLGKLSAEDRLLVELSTTVPPHKCCSNPTWLYRIYQDTRVDLLEVTRLINDALSESRMVLGSIRSGSWSPAMTELLPPLIDGITCLESTDRPAGELWAEWQEPWNGARVTAYSIHVDNNGREYESKGPVMAINGFQPGEEVVFFVRPIVGKFRGEFSNVGRCTV